MRAASRSAAFCSVLPARPPISYCRAVSELTVKKAIVKVDFFFQSRKKKNCICSARHENFCMIAWGQAWTPSHSSRVTSEQSFDWKNEINPIRFFTSDHESQFLSQTSDKIAHCPEGRWCSHMKVALLLWWSHNEVDQKVRWCH